VEKVRGDGAGHYLAKYLGKSSAAVREVPGLVNMAGRHRFGKSQNITFMPFRHKSDGWERRLVSYKDSLRSFKRQGAFLEAKEEGVPSFTARLGYVDYRGLRVKSAPVELVSGQVSWRWPIAGRQ
jgi:hypothetical protein